MGSITSFGVSEVLKCDTDDPFCSGFGAYISTWPLPESRPPERVPLFVATAGPIQWRSPVSIAEATRSAFDMSGHCIPVLWSSRFSMKVSSKPFSFAPVVALTKVRKPSPCPISWSTTAMKSIWPPGGAPSRP